MEEIFNKIIEIDNKAKLIVNDEKEKKNNLDEYIEKEVNIKKNVLDFELKNEIEKEKIKYEKLFQEKKYEIDNEIRKKIELAEEIYREKEDKIIDSIISNIKNEED